MLDIMEASPPPKIAVNKVQETLHFRYLKFSVKGRQVVSRGEKSNPLYFPHKKNIRVVRVFVLHRFFFLLGGLEKNPSQQKTDLKMMDIYQACFQSLIGILKHMAICG